MPPQENVLLNVIFMRCHILISQSVPKLSEQVML